MNYELYPSFKILISVSDGDSTTQATVTINLNDVNEYPALNTFSFNVDELSSNGTVVGTITATDPDIGQSLYYFITTGNYNDAFTLDSVSGEIIVLDSTKLDYEGNYPSYSLQITVKDNGVPQLETYNYIYIAVNDISEAPVMNNQTFHIDENSPVNTIAGNIQATDPDTGGSLSYSIISGNENGIFSLNTSGTLSVVIPDSLNYEETTEYNFVVKVTDNTSLTDTATVTVMVDNVNEPPYFTSQDTFYVDENSPYQTVVGKVEGSDPDGDNVGFYSQSSTSFPAFFINTDGTIEVFQADSLDFETQNSRTVIAVAQSNGYLKAYDTLTIMLNDVNEAPIVVDNQVAHIDEHSPVGTIVDTVKTITDAGESLTYSIESGNLHNAYVIDSLAGVIRVQYTDSLDVNNGAKLQIKVVDNSAEQYSGEGYIWVYVNNVNDPPVISHQVFYFTDANPYQGEHVGDIIVVDPDNNTITYTIESGNTNNAFLIYSSGELVVNNPDALNDDISSYDLLVRAADAEYSDTAIITVNLFPSKVLDKSYESFVKIYPNPVKDILHIDIKNVISDIHISIFDIHGKLIYKKSYSNSNLIDMQKYSKGIYLIKINYQGKNYFNKVVLE